MYRVFTCGFDNDCLCKATLRDEGIVCTQWSDVIIYHQFSACSDEWMAAFFYPNSIWKNPISLCFLMASGKKDGEAHKRNFSTQEVSFIYLSMQLSRGLIGLITQKRGKLRWNAITQLYAKCPELWSCCRCITAILSKWRSDVCTVIM